MTINMKNLKLSLFTGELQGYFFLTLTDVMEDVCLPIKKSDAKGE